MQARVSIGFPVYNGEIGLSKALDSLLQQDFGDFEIILSDNGSTDETPEICAAYAKKDTRIRYYPHAQNRGAAWNFNEVFRLSSGEYFKWAAHDDYCGPSFLRKCVETLDEHPDVVLACTRSYDVDEKGLVQERVDKPVKFQSGKVHTRFRELICHSHGCMPVFGLMRASVLRKTGLIGSYAASDRVLLAELALYGRFFENPDRLFYHGEHSRRSTRIFSSVYCIGEWFDPKKAGEHVLPTWRLLKEYVAAIRRSQLPTWDRLLTKLQVVPWLWKKKKRLRQDLWVFTKSALSGSEQYYLQKPNDVPTVNK